MYDELSYLAGLFDGEGSIRISKAIGKHVAKSGHSYTLRVTLRMTDEETVRKFAQYFKHESVRCISNTKPEWKLIWRCDILSNDALIVCQTFLPFLGIKKEQAKLGIEFQTNRPRGLARGQQEEERLERLYQQMKKLNKRGKD